MASYNKAKLTALLERQHAHGVMAHDVSNRRQDAKDTVNRIKNHIRAACRGLRPDAERKVDEILRMPAAQALGVSREITDQFIPWSTWQDLLQAMGRLERLEAEVERLAGIREEQFAVIPNLLHAVRRWGFKDPTMEVA
jgi:hypothetical protein